MEGAKGKNVTTHDRGCFVTPKLLQIKVLDEVCNQKTREKDGGVRVGRKKKRVGDILPLRVTVVVA